MSDSPIANRFVARSSLDALATQSDDEVCDNLGCFGWLRGIRDRAVMLELRRRGGNILAINYGWIERLEFDPSEGITVQAGGQRIRIKGKHLNDSEGANPKLFDGLTRHRVPWVQERSLGDAFAGRDGSCLVEAIEW